ncbi:hypothetical protein BayCH28_21820 [Mycolicibacterium sp. CH28]|uniref:hypothetical protein n=1 Tax=Mycolicibacterium sp. CH28 TaxID=2512237 RepID=UPI00108164E9|nr:hypothetical protein [Mycolicibacterium sp. CH28]TGD85661.1 hypothetical protein BayCH28_21820 [Mycolicibacterium sp. CH28]
MSLNRNSIVALIGGALTATSLMLAVPASADPGHGATASSSNSGSALHSSSQTGPATSVGAPKTNATNPGRVGAQWVVPGWDEGM